MVLASARTAIAPPGGEWQPYVQSFLKIYNESMSLHGGAADHSPVDADDWARFGESAGIQTLPWGAPFDESALAAQHGCEQARKAYAETPSSASDSPLPYSSLTALVAGETSSPAADSPQYLVTPPFSGRGSACSADQSVTGRSSAGKAPSRLHGKPCWPLAAIPMAASRAPMTYSPPLRPIGNPDAPTVPVASALLSSSLPHLGATDYSANTPRSPLAIPGRPIAGGNQRELSRSLPFVQTAPQMPSRLVQPLELLPGRPSSSGQSASDTDERLAPAQGALESLQALVRHIETDYANADADTVLAVARSSLNDMCVRQQRRRYRAPGPTTACVSRLLRAAERDQQLQQRRTGIVAEAARPSVAPIFMPTASVAAGAAAAIKALLGSTAIGATVERSAPSYRFTCDECGQRFTRGHDLKRHRRQHTNERPFKCDRCKRGFSRSDALARHTKMDCCGGVSLTDSSLLAESFGNSAVKPEDRDSMASSVELQ